MPNTLCHCLDVGKSDRVSFACWIFGVSPEFSDLKFIHHEDDHFLSIFVKDCTTFPFLFIYQIDITFTMSRGRSLVSISCYLVVWIYHDTAVGLRYGIALITGMNLDSMG